MGLKWIAVTILLSLGSLVYANEPKVQEIEVRLGPSLYLNSEYGVLYSNTGFLPAQIELLCKTTEADKAELAPCGSINVGLQIKSYGLSAFWLNYTRRNPLRIRLYVDPNEALLSDVLGSYVGGRAGVGLGVGARGMVLLNSSSGVFATTEQNLMPMGAEDPGFQIGVDLSVPQLVIHYEGKDSNRSLASFAI